MYLKNNFIYNRLFGCNQTCYRVRMVSVMSASRYERRSSMYIRGLIPRSALRVVLCTKKLHFVSKNWRTENYFCSIWGQPY